MSEDDTSSGEKSYEPTPQKLEQARKKGDIPRSMDLSSAAAFIGLFLALSLFGYTSVIQSSEVLASFLSLPDQLSGVVLAEGGKAAVGPIMWQWIVLVLPLFALPFFAALLTLAAQRAIIFSPDKITPKLSRISIISNAKNKYGLDGIVQFIKSTVKLIAVSLALVWLFRDRWEEFVGAISESKFALASLIASTVLALLFVTCVIYSIIALADYMWQRQSHHNKMRMTHQEMKDEHKQSEGDPFVKAQRRQKGFDIATNQMLQDVPDANVVIVNPKHFAVALSWSRAKGEAPICVAKGVDEIAARIREIANENAVPLYRDPPTARSLHATCDIGAQIEEKDYKAVAAAIRFADNLREKLKASPWST